MDRFDRYVQKDVCISRNDKPAVCKTGTKTETDMSVLLIHFTSKEKRRKRYVLQKLRRTDE